MNRLDYLIKKRQTNPEIVRDFWAALGEIEVSNRTRAYTKNTIVKIKVDDYENQQAKLTLQQTLGADTEAKILQQRLESY